MKNRTVRIVALYLVFASIVGGLTLLPLTRDWPLSVDILVASPLLLMVVFVIMAIKSVRERHLSLGQLKKGDVFIARETIPDLHDDPRSDFAGTIVDQFETPGRGQSPRSKPDYVWVCAHDQLTWPAYIQLPTRTKVHRTSGAN